jgi:predicted CoA-binding protein
LTNHDDDLARRILTSFDTIAVVGLSRDPAKAAHTVPATLQGAGYRIIPVNPFAERILGRPAYRSLADIPEPVEIVQLFRPVDEAPAVAEQAVAIGAKALWLQLGLVSTKARRIAEHAGLLYIEDRCLAVDHARLGISAHSHTLH